MRRIMVRLLAVLILGTVLFGCTAWSAEKTKNGEAGQKGVDGAVEGQSIVIYDRKVEIYEQISEFASLYKELTGVDVTVKISGGDSAYEDTLKAEFQSDRQPDIFLIQGKSDYETWKSKITPFDDDDWIELTDYEFIVDGKVYGFPVAVEGYGLAYNAELLTQAGINPETLTSQEVYKAAFEKLDKMKDELGIDAVVSMGAGADLRWVTGTQNFNGYLAGGLEYSDTMIVDMLNNGETDIERLSEYADWVELLFKYSEKSVLLTGNYDAQVSLFATGKAVFIQQGNWIDPWLTQNGISFEMGFAPQASVYGENDAIFIGVAAYYVLNKDSENLEAAKDFLNYMATSEEGHKYMVKEAGMVPAFKNVTLTPTTPLSAALMKWIAKENGAFAWNFAYMPSNFGTGELGPIYELFARGDITKQDFITQFTAKISAIK